MSRETSPFTLGKYWLDKRRDGLSPKIWQIAHYPEGSRSPVYKSTKCTDVKEAEEVLRAVDAAERSKTKQAPDDAELIPHLFNFVEEHGPDVLRLDTIESSFRAWIGFLMQDELGTGAMVSDMNKISVGRFRRWRMGEHSWEVPWGDRIYRHESKGVSGEAVQRNIEDLRSALKHAEDAIRISMYPRIPSVPKMHRSPPRKHRFTIKQLGAIVGYARQEKPVEQWLWLMIGTGMRPDAALAFDPKKQWFGALADLHPPAWPVTDKRNPIVPVIEPLGAMFKGWKHEEVKSRKKWWRTMRGLLGIPNTHVPKTIRHTVATFLRSQNVPGEQISALLGHKDTTDTLELTSEFYAHADPLKMRKTTKALTIFWERVEREADKWSADHLLTIAPDGNKTLIDKRTQKS